MINKKDVVRMKVPFPNIDSGLAIRAHMYICMEEGTNKEFIKCQTFKPVHLIKNRRPLKVIVEDPHIDRNPFLNKTTIDCDKSFYLRNVKIDPSLITPKRRDICEELFHDIKSELNHEKFTKESLDDSLFLELNPLAQSI